MMATNIKEELEQDKRDVADIWSAAVEAYRGATKIPIENLPVPKFRSTEDIITYGNQQMDEFHKFRHNQKKVDKLRGLFKQSMNLVQKGAEQLAAAATPAFPPAGAIMTAFSYMLNACKQVSADYDVVTAFFEDMNSFLQRVTILETRLPKYRAYRNCLMEVFTSLLTLCGFATRYVLEGRFKKWITNMLRGEDSALGGARKSMDTAIDRLQSATEFAILGNTEELQKMNAELRENQEAQTRILENVAESQDQMLVMLKLIKANIDVQKHDAAKTNQAPATKGTAAGAIGVKNTFVLKVDPMAEYREIKSHLIQGTCAWLWQEPAWEAFTGQQTRILTIAGSPGSGKSSMAALAYDKLRESALHQTGSRTCVACYFFREIYFDSLNIYYLVQWLVVQVAEQDTDLCEVILSQLKREDWEWWTVTSKELWRTLLVPLFEQGTKYRFQIVLDGVDELSEFYRNSLLVILTDIEEMKLNIDVICTVRSSLVDTFGTLQTQSIVVDKQKQLPDIEILIQNRLNSGSRLRKFSTKAKTKIATILSEKAPDLLFADNVLRRCNMIGREGAVLNQLTHQIPDSIESIYQSSLSEIQRRIPPEHLEKYRVLVDWLVYSFKPVTVSVLSTLQRLIPLDTPHGIEDDLYEKFGRVLYLNDSSTIAKQAETPDLVKQLGEIQVSEDIDHHNDDLLEVRFRERPFRDFLRAAETVQGLRTPRAVAHARLLAMCARILCDGELNADASADKSLRDYAARKWINHFTRTEFSALTPEERVLAIEALAKIMTNKNNVARFFESVTVNYGWMIGTWVNKTTNEQIATWAKDVLSQHGDLVQSNVRPWLEEIADQPGKVWIQLAKAHVYNWFKATDSDSATDAFNFAWSAFTKTDLCDLTETEIASGNGGEEGVSKLRDAFDIPLDANAHAMIATIFRGCGFNKSALTEAQAILGLNNGSTPTFEVLVLTASVQLELKQFDEAEKSIVAAFESGPSSSLEPKAMREALLLRGQIELAMEKLDVALQTFEYCRSYSPDDVNSAEVLISLLKTYDLKGDFEGFVAAFRQWSLIDRIVLLTSFRGDDIGDDDALEMELLFSKTMMRAGAAAYLVEVYEEVIKYLDRVDAGAPLRVSLASLRKRLDDDGQASKGLLNEILDSEYPVTGYALTEADPGEVLFETFSMMYDILYEEFRVTQDSTMKNSLLKGCQDLPNRKLALAYPQRRSNINHFALLDARMLRKMGPSSEYERVLRGAFSACYEALTDTVGFNDSDNLADLTMILADIPGFENEARIIFSATFSKLDPDVADDTFEDDSEYEDSDEDEETEEDTPASNTTANTNEGDIAKGIKYYCAGACEPKKVARRWNGNTWYRCLTCSECMLCADCYNKRQEYNSGKPCEPWAKYCGQNHRYIKGPMAGWRGVTQGMVDIEGQEPFAFSDWLKDLKEVKWEKYWTDFWLNENVGPSLL